MHRFPALPAPEALIDTHCHLDAPELAPMLAAVLERARAAGVGQILVPAVRADTFDAAAAMRRDHGCWIGFGLHPIYLERHLDEHLEQLERALREQRPEAVGEIGLDFYLPELDPARQEALFVEQLKLARKYALPVVLHVRRSVDRVLKHLREQRVELGIAHAFNGSPQQAEAMLRQGMKLGFGGAMSYSGSQRIRRLAATLPLSGLVLETDAPDIRPEFAQDRPNEPAHLAAFSALLAELRGVPEPELRRALRRNSLDALGIAG
ncbi:TatD family hydrolase [Chromobacterium alkanivorans]|uniref:TatD family hydrolase n=1 Tax=Chromobacterium TaxID=535 RepID=UPI0006538C77|nr:MULTISPECIES: TatD family hydrolase [Chromobacterium]KMN82875.1 DNAase [Chromobacterium sp. LK11]MBN3002233.1 TatD family hydrolase [Chromobacterium alkanivorans]